MYLRDILGEEKYAEYDQRRMQLMAEEMEKATAAQPDTYPQEAHTLVIAQAEFLSARILSSRTKLRYYSVGREEIGMWSGHYVHVRTVYHNQTEQTARDEINNLIYLFGAPNK